MPVRSVMATTALRDPRGQQVQQLELWEGSAPLGAKAQSGGEAPPEGVVRPVEIRLVGVPQEVKLAHGSTQAGSRESSWVRGTQDPPLRPENIKGLMSCRSALQSWRLAQLVCNLALKI